MKRWRVFATMSGHSGSSGKKWRYACVVVFAGNADPGAAHRLCIPVGEGCRFPRFPG